MRNRSFLLALFHLCLLSCKKEDIEIDSQKIVIKEKKIYAGLIEVGDTLYELNSKINFRPFCSGKNCVEVDSVDFLNDGIYDLKFTKQSWYYSSHGGYYSSYSDAFSVTVLSSNIRLGKTSSDGIINPVDSNFKVDKNFFLTSDPLEGGFLYYSPNAGSEWYTQGGTYLAFMLISESDSLYGWIRINGLSRMSEYGINKLAI